MIRILIIPLCTLILSLSAHAMNWQVFLGSNFFAPDSLVVAFGDTVTWTNLEGTHNIVEQTTPPLFTSGEPAPPPWNFEYVFNLPLGTYTYQCEVHAPEMTGTVTVIPYGTPPNIAFNEPWSVPENANAGFGFRMTVRPTDEDQVLTGFAIAVNDSNEWSDWSPFPEFLICDTSLGLFPEDVTLISNTALFEGVNTLYFQAIDSRLVLSPVINRSVTVQSHQPFMDTVVTGTYGGNDIYPDGSVFYQDGAEITLNLSANAILYRGVINGYRFRDSSGEWSDWFASPAIDLPGLLPGNYPFTFMARDIAGALSESVDYVFRVIDFALSDTIVLVDETRNGTGAPGSPSDAQVDDFYHARLNNYVIRDHDYTLYPYVSPFTLQNAGLVVWHAEDKAELKLGDNTRLLSDYLNRGGRLLLSGWDVFGPFVSGDSAAFDTTDFAFAQLGAVSARRDPSASPRRCTGFSGDNGFPGCQLDSTKLPASYHGALDRLWTFQPRDNSAIVGRLTVNNSGQNPLEGRPAAYLFGTPFSVAVSGVPLYFCYDDDVQALFDTLVPMLIGPTDASAHPQRVTDYTLEQNYPNPFNGATVISFSVPQNSQTSIRVYDLLGRHVATVLEQQVLAGLHRVSFDGSALASGIYFVQMRAGQYTAHRKMVLLK